MRVRPNGLASHSLLSESEGELVEVRLSADPRLLEDLLECLASVSFPVNPQICHGRPTEVIFPSYYRHLPEVRTALQTFGFDPSTLRVSNMLDAIACAS